MRARSTPQYGALHGPVLAPYLLVVALLALLGLASVDILSAVRAYVGGESLWSKAQKDASGRLGAYVRSGDRREREAFDAALKVPLGDRKARLALDREPADVETARAGFLEGGNSAEDIDAMIRLYRTFRRVPFMADAIAIWAEGDTQIVALQALADEVDAAGESMTPAQRETFARRTAELEVRLTGLAERFSARLGEASRSTQEILSIGTLAVAALLALMGGLFVQRALGRLAASERSLREGNERFELAAAASGIGVFEWDTARGEVLVDARGLALHGLVGFTGRLPEARLRETVQPEDRARIDAAHAGTGAGGLWSERYRVPHPDGEVRHIELVARRAAAGGVLVGVMRDVTAQVDADRLRLEKLAAEQASAAKTAFLSRASHELRTPLNAVLGFAQMMRFDHREPLGAEQARRLSQIERGGGQLLRLVGHLLDLATLEQPDLTLQHRDVGVSELLARSVERIEPLRAARRVGIELLPGVEPLQVHVDPDAAAHLVANLLANAVKHGPADATVSVYVGAEADRVSIEIRDRGPGMTRAQMGQLFQPFSRAGAEYSPVDGAGLGLVVAQQLAARLGGSIELRSEPGEGTQAVVRLPRSRR